MQKAKIKILTFTITLLISFGVFRISHLLIPNQIQETAPAATDNLESKQSLQPSDPTKAEAISDSISISPCKDAAAIKPAMSYQKMAVSLGVVNSRVLCGKLPEYSPALKSRNISGVVIVFVKVNEQGEVAEARATSGHKLLRSSAEKAAFQTKFSPLRLRGDVHRMFGSLVYQFDPNRGVSLINPLSPNNPLRKH